MSFLDAIYKHNPYPINPFYSLVIIYALAFVPHLLKGVLIREKLQKSGKQYTIANSRLQTIVNSDQTPEGRRISILAGCHNNGLEAFTLFSVAVLAAVVTKVPHDVINGAASLYVASRIVYTSVYLSPLNGALRTAVWLVGVWIAGDLLLKAAQNYQI